MRLDVMAGRWNSEMEDRGVLFKLFTEFPRLIMDLDVSTVLILVPRPMGILSFEANKVIGLLRLLIWG